jgi:hypothetical protein
MPQVKKKFNSIVKAFSNKRFTSIQAVFIRLASLRFTSLHFASLHSASLPLYSFFSFYTAFNLQHQQQASTGTNEAIKIKLYFFGHLLQWFTYQQFFFFIRNVSF